MSKPFPLTLRVLAHLLSYPAASLRDHMAEMTAALQRERALGADRLEELSALMQHLRGARAMDVEAHYVETFDRGRGTALHLFEHVHGDSRDRGPAMIDLLKTYEQAGLYLAPGELPDHLAVVLEYASTQPPAQARAFLRELTHILQAIFSALLRRESPYASVLAAVLELAGEKAQAVKIPDEPTLDESWEEPAAFGGCSTQGQASPGQPQPIQLVRAAARQASNQPGASA
ncbi:nitrate reductase molybdenum cofactor assembly chaperone [Rubrivivax albus]|uniref:Nitrate reductase molybdenum cofactor assembly chaperone n=1 Tax=Rubrivivax albus TaxID=2499835 RepID=A0A437JTN3_9BURK|nr:nitrate reductase molybdenum cofactor assembly chaperone [Rubrivivax albus]RVT50533.1 nitrate reductase molybdenum cofactor assembly chaperone [Rubrivivax albus]